MSIWKSSDSGWLASMLEKGLVTPEPEIRSWN